MNTISQRDSLFQTAQTLSFDDLKHLCQTNRAYRTLCSEPRFQALIQRRYSEEIQTKIENIFDDIEDMDLTLKYELIRYTETPTMRAHGLKLQKGATGKIESVEESILGIPLEKSLIYRLYKKKTGFPGIENLSQKEFINYAMQLNQNRYNVNELLEKNYGKYLLLDGLMSKTNDENEQEYRKLHPNDIMGKHQRFSFYQVSNWGDGKLTLEHPTDQDLQIIFSEMVKLYSNYLQV